MSSPAAGYFITLEGGEGTGKSTLQAALQVRLDARGISSITTREPGGTPRAEAIRELVLQPPGGEAFSPLAETLLMNAARSDHLEAVIRPALAGGQWVICDRFSDSTRVYQGALGGVSARVIDQLEASVVGATRPNLTLVLDAPVETALTRRKARAGESDVFERRDGDFHRRVRDAFIAIAHADPDRCRLIDASRPASDVESTAWMHVERLLVGAG
jgi:dTMP kinase